MDRLHMILLVLSGVVSFSQYSISSSVMEVTVRPGDNITLYCDCKGSIGVYIVWFRNCSHENQPSLVLEVKEYFMEEEYHLRFHRFTLLPNISSSSYDLVIMNVTDTDEGLYYCGAKETIVEKNKTITSKNIYQYSNMTTRLTVNSRTTQDCSLCWKLLVFLCPAVSVLSALLSSVLVYLLFQRTAKRSQNNEKKCVAVAETQNEDVCYAALEIRPSSQRPKEMSSVLSTYSAIKTSRREHSDLL